MRIALIVLLIWLCPGGRPAAAEPFSLTENQEKHLLDLQNKAREKKLAGAPQWRRLMHYHDRLGSKESTVDSGAFFLLPEGKTNPDKELQADLRAFFMPVDKADKIEGKDDTYNHPQCLFPARYDWLNRQLGFDPRLMPPVKCKDYQDFKSAVEARRAALIFTSAYMGNPASFFGHTLLRLDSREETPLLSHALNYGAITGSDGGLSFMFKGVFGGYNGIFSVYPYYDTVNLYNNMENRDIWEYRLNLTPEQIDRLVAHIWELGHNSANYYFFSENCSYMLLETLNAVFPEQDLTEPFYRPLFSNYTIPVDTIRTVLKQKDILKEAVYRPSRQSKLKHAYSFLSDEEKEQLHKLLKSPRQVDSVMNSALTDEQKANVLVTAYEYVQYAFVAGDIPLDEMRRDSIKILTPLSSIKEKSNITDVPVPAKRPDEGHLSGAAAIYGGRRNHKDFIDITLRPAYHTLTDETAGFLPFGAITYMDATLRWYENDNDLRLQKFSFVDIMSLAPRNKLFKPFSFKLNAGVESYFYPDKDKEGYVFYAGFGAGWSGQICDEVIAYLMTNIYGKAGGYLPHNTMAGAGVQAGFAADFDFIRLTGDIEKIFYTDKAADIWRYQASAGITLTHDWGLEASFIFEDSRHTDVHEGRLGLVYHF
ncbi:MAG: DUF4105 domain-containing protein [Alphaproteobacteria bacterium]